MGKRKAIWEAFRIESHIEGGQRGNTAFSESCQEFGKSEHGLRSKDCQKKSNMCLIMKRYIEVRK